jgi:hypothetical protein
MVQVLSMTPRLLQAEVLDADPEDSEIVADPVAGPVGKLRVEPSRGVLVGNVPADDGLATVSTCCQSTGGVGLKATRLSTCIVMVGVLELISDSIRVQRLQQCIVSDYEKCCRRWFADCVRASR